MAKSTQAEAAITRQKIVDAAFHITLETGFENVTLGKLAKEVGITRSGVNCHFKKKQDLIEVLKPLFGAMLIEPLDFGSADGFYASWVTALESSRDFTAAVKACGPIIPTREGIDSLINKIDASPEDATESVFKCIGYATYTLG
jgi:DNA-binding transcriptional regulator YbjK